MSRIASASGGSPTLAPLPPPLGAPHPPPSPPLPPPHGGMTIRLHEQNRFGIERQPNLCVLLHAANRDAIEKLQRARNDLVGNDRRNSLRRGIHALERRGQRLLRRRRRHKLEQ